MSSIRFRCRGAASFKMADECRGISRVKVCLKLQFSEPTSTISVGLLPASGCCQCCRWIYDVMYMRLLRRPFAVNRKGRHAGCLIATRGVGGWQYDIHQHNPITIKPTEVPYFRSSAQISVLTLGHVYPVRIDVKLTSLAIPFKYWVHDIFGEHGQ